MGEPNTITTHSVEEGLDFACSLASHAIGEAGEASAEQSQRLLRELTSYVQFRYVGETGLALESLVWLGQQCSPSTFRSELFWRQLRWVAEAMGLAGTDLERMEFPNA